MCVIDDAQDSSSVTSKTWLEAPERTGRRWFEAWYFVELRCVPGTPVRSAYPVAGWATDRTEIDYQARNRPSEAFMGMACSDGRRHPRMDDWAGLGRRRARSMAYWLEGLEILGCFHCSANDHAP
jgi:hypothetical protein